MPSQSTTLEERMMKTIRWSLLATVLISLLFLSGCAMHVKMSPPAADARIANKHIDAKVGLFMDAAFSNYHWQGPNSAEMSKMDYELGAASKSLFLESFMRIAKSVVLVDSPPPYSDPDKKDIAVVVKPSFMSFSEDHSAIVRITDYTAELTYHVTAFGANGDKLIDKNFTGKGVARGEATYSVASNYAAAAEKAMTAALAAIIDDLVKLKLGG